MAKAGNGMWLDEHGGYIQNMKTGDCMKVRIENGTYVFDVELDNGEAAKVTTTTPAQAAMFGRREKQQGRRR